MYFPQLMNCTVLSLPPDKRFGVCVVILGHYTPGITPLSHGKMSLSHVSDHRQKMVLFTYLSVKCPDPRIKMAVSV